MALNSGECAGNVCSLQLDPVEQTVESGYYDLEWNPVGEDHPQQTNSTSKQNDPISGDLIRGGSVSGEPRTTATTLEISNEETFNEISHKIDISYQDSVHLTGFPNGVYYIRLLDKSGMRVSNISQVNVEHHSMSRVWVIFTMGAILFALLMGYMVAKVFRNQDD